MPKFAANLTMMFNEVDFLDRFEAAAKCGFKGVEFLFPYAWDKDVLAEKLEKNGFQQALFNLPPGDWDAGDRGMAAIPGREAEFKDTVGLALEYAKALKCPTVHAMSGCAPEGVSLDAMSETLVSNLQYAADVYGAEGIDLIIEPLNSRNVPGYFLAYQGDAVKVIELCDKPNLGLQLDLYHVQIMEGDLAVHLKEFAGVTKHIQIAGVPERHEPDVGEVNYPYLFSLMDELGYAGWVGCEYTPKGKTEDGLGWFEAYK